MPVIESIRESQGQIIARVFVERSEIVRHDDLLPYFHGKRYRALGHMTLIIGEDWKTWGADNAEVRIVEVVVTDRVEPPRTTDQPRPRRDGGHPEQLSLPAPSQAKRRKRP